MKLKKLFPWKRLSPKKGGFFLLIAAVLFSVWVSAISHAAPFAYIPNYAGDSVSVIDTLSDTVTDTISLGTSVSEPYGVFVNDDGTRVYVTSYGNSPYISEIDTTTNNVIRTLILPATAGGQLYGIVSNPSGSLLYIAYAKRNVLSVYDTAQARETAAIAVGTDPHGVVMNPDGTRIYVTNYGSSSVSVINTSTHKVVANITVGSGPHGIAISPNGTRIYTANVWSDTVSVINTTTNSLIATVTTGKYPYCPAVNPDGSRVYVTNSGNGTVSVIDTNTNSVLSSINVGTGPHGISLHPAGTKAYVANEGGNTVSVIDLTTAKVTAVPVAEQPIGFGRFISPKDIKHQLNATLNPKVVTPGMTIDWQHEIIPGTLTGDVDLFLATIIPGGGFFFFGPEGLGEITTQPIAHRWGFPAEKEKSYTLFFDFPFPSSFPEGEYYFYSVLVRSGNIIADSNNWISNLTVSKFDFSLLSPSQKATIQSGGYPDSLIKSFSDGIEGKRVDETWVYADEGIAVSFVNGVFIGENDATVPTPGQQAGPTVPGGYHFDTSLATVIAKHGQPLASQEHTVWDGTFKNYVYDGAFFGFHNNSLVSAIVTNYPAGSAANESNRPENGDLGDSSIRAADSVEDVNTGYLFTLASLLGAGAYFDAPGFSSDYSQCMNLIKNDEPTQVSLACFQDALDAVSTNQAQHGRQLVGSGLQFLAQMVQGTASSDEPAEGSGTQPGCKASCYASANPPTIPLHSGEHKVKFQFILSSFGAKNIESVFLMEEPMAKVSGSIWEKDLIITTTFPESAGGQTLFMYAKNSKGDTICFTSAFVDYVPADLSVSIQGPKSAVKGTNPTYTAVVDGHAGSYGYSWSYPGGGVVTGSKKPENSQRILLKESGNKVISVKVHDEKDGSRSASASYSVTVEDKLKVIFVSQPYEVPAGDSSSWSVKVEGGTKPYITTWDFSDGFGNSSSVFTSVEHPGFDDLGIYYCGVTVTDSSSPPQSGGVSSVILSSCYPDDCCPNFPVKCANSCYPSNYFCCQDVKVCERPEYILCCGIGCCPKGAKCCDESIPTCCWNNQECCGKYCCDPGTFCCNNGNGCCPDGYLCHPNGGCYK